MTINNGYVRYYLSGTHSAFYSKLPIDSVASIHTMGSKRKKSLINRVHFFFGKDTLTIVGSHLSSSNHHVRMGYQKRKYEADDIYESIKNEEHPIIVMGDLNDIPGSYAVERIKEAGLKDAWWEGGLGYGLTFHNKWLRLRLDHVLYQDDKLKLQYVKIIDSDLSDHNAVVAGFTLKNWQYDNTCINK
jgi:endonuclease/exonuclease/phosphatase (EEP) superfamily protein YafD